MKSTLLINTREAWTNLKIAAPEICILSNLKDPHVVNEGPRILARTIVLDNCNHNFVYYYLNDRVFPIVTTLILNSHPADVETIRWMAKRPHVETWVHQRQYSDVTRVAKIVNVDISHIHQISDVSYRKLLNEFLADQPKLMNRD